MQITYETTQNIYIMDNCYLVVHNAQNQHVIAVCKKMEAAVTLAGRLNQRAGVIIYKIKEKKFIW